MRGLNVAVDRPIGVYISGLKCCGTRKRSVYTVLQFAAFRSVESMSLLVQVKFSRDPLKIAGLEPDRLSR